MRFLNEPQLATRCATNALRYAREHFDFTRMMEAKLAVDLALVASSRPEPSRTPATTTAPLPARANTELVSVD
jgi:hypothetical protein